jgi:hypothetical protein
MYILLPVGNFEVLHEVLVHLQGHDGCLQFILCFVCVGVLFGKCCGFRNLITCLHGGSLNVLSCIIEGHSFEFSDWCVYSRGNITIVMVLGVHGIMW